MYRGLALSFTRKGSTAGLLPTVLGLRSTFTAARQVVDQSDVGQMLTYLSILYCMAMDGATRQDGPRWRHVHLESIGSC